MNSITKKQIEEIEEKVKLANAEFAALEARLANRKPEPGTLLLLPGVDPTWIWAGLTWHSESDDLLFCVPADDAPLTGAADLQTDEASLFVTLRCGYGIWFSRPLLDKTVVVGEVSPGICDAALDRIVRMIDGQLVPSVDGDDGEEDLDNWYDCLDRVVSEVRKLRDVAEEEAEAALRKKVVLFRTPVPRRELAWAATGPVVEWLPMAFDGPDGKKFELAGGEGDRENMRTKVSCVLVDEPSYPVAVFGLGLELADGRTLYANEGDVRDGDIITFEGVASPDDVLAIVVSARRQDSGE